MRVRMLAIVAAAAGIAAPIAARAEPASGSTPGSTIESTIDSAIEASGFVGVDWFGVHSALGNSWAPEQVPGTSPVVGARIGWLAVPDLPDDLQLALEAEVGFAPAFTGDNALHGRMAYFAPVFEWRGQAVLRLVRSHAVMPHLVLGLGGDTVASRSPFMSDDTEPIAYWGPGLSAPLAGGWQLRLDVRHGVMPARTGGVTSTLELELGLGLAFGTASPRVRRAPAPEAPEAPEVPKAPETREAPTAATSPAAAPPALAPAAATAAPPALAPDPDADRDGDGIPDRIDACPDEPETWNDVDDDDGCPEDDRDGDGILGSADRCPDEPEDKDGWEDEDGCPDPDNDGDGIDDAHDACPDQPETVNGFEDDDGCPDEVPAEIRDTLGTTVRFEPGHARVTEAAGTALRTLRELLERRPALRIAIIGHAERAGGDELARRRADAVKWYLIDRGIAEDRITAGVGAVPGAPAITFQLARPRQ